MKARAPNRWITERRAIEKKVKEVVTGVVQDRIKQIKIFTPNDSSSQDRKDGSSEIESESEDEKKK